MSTQDSRKQSFAAPNYSGGVNHDATGGSDAVSPRIMPPHATLPQVLPSSPAATSSPAMKFHQQGGSSMAADLPCEDYPRLSSVKGHNHDGKKGKRMFSKDHHKHKSSAAHYEHGSGNPSPSHKHLQGTAVATVSAIQEPSVAAEFNAFAIRTCWRDDVDTVDPSYTPETNNPLLLPVIDGGKEMAGIVSYAGGMSRKRPRKRHKHELRHKHGAKHKHKHRHREPYETSQFLGAEQGSVPFPANELERDRRVHTGNSQKFAAVDKQAKKHKHHHHRESKRDFQLTTADAMLKQSEALFPDASDGSALRKEETELENQMLIRRASMISRDFFLSRPDGAIDDVLQRHTEHVDQLAEISPDFSHLVLSRKHYMRSSRDVSGMPPPDSTSLSSPSDRRTTPDFAHRLSTTESFNESMAPRSRDAVERDELPTTFSHQPINCTLLADVTTLGPLNSVTLQELRVNDTGKGVANSGRTEIVVKEHRGCGVDVYKAADTADIAGPTSRSKGFGAEQNLDSSLTLAVRTAVSGLQRTQLDETFSFVPDCSNRKVNEQCDAFRPLPQSQLDSNVGELVPSSSCLSVAPVVCEASDNTEKVAHQTLSAVEQTIPSKSTEPPLPCTTENTFHDESAISHTTVDAFDKVGRDSEQVSSKSAKKTDTRQQARDHQSGGPPASLSGHAHEPDNNAVTTYEAAPMEQLRDPRGHLVSHVKYNLVVQELSEQSVGYGILEESGKNLHPALAASQERANGAIDALETEIKLMIGLPTSEAGLKAHVSLEDFETILEGQEHKPVDQEASSPKELQLRQEEKIVELQSRAPLGRVSSEQMVGTLEETEVTHEAPASLPPNKESEPPVRSPGSTKVVSGVVLDAPIETKAVMPPESVKRESLTIRMVPVVESQHHTTEAASKIGPEHSGNKNAKASHRPSSAWHKKKARSALRRSLDLSRDHTTTSSPPSTSMSPAAVAMLPGKCRGSLDTATLYAVKPRRSTSKPQLWHELSAVMSRPVLVGISTPGTAGVVMLMDEDEIEAQLNHVLPAGSQVHLRELEIYAGKARVNGK
ncbi:hypothetical protein HPB51_005902 [Rhipicephalus microplus]|uniref:Uncharacterized protein n=1 Tax=Rhipicephalus microplus TaxID=6941 RepID=A0A9J6D4S5_RHIMP|nr:hypothetical protein HPB51_005902 [Rhipicephalus microplus]